MIEVQGSWRGPYHRWVVIANTLSAQPIARIQGIFYGIKKTYEGIHRRVRNKIQEDSN
jgi:hypothetical protein